MRTWLAPWARAVSSHLLVGASYQPRTALLATFHTQALPLIEMYLASIPPRAGGAALAAAQAALGPMLGGPPAAAAAADAEEAAAAEAEGAAPVAPPCGKDARTVTPLPFEFPPAPVTEDVAVDMVRVRGRAHASQHGGGGKGGGAVTEDVAVDMVRTEGGGGRVLHEREGFH